MLSRAKGFTLVEMLLSILLMSILMALALPSYSEWIQNQQIRTTAEGIYNALQLAQGEAAKRNQAVDFALISSTPQTGATPAISSVGPNWQVSLDQGGVPMPGGFVQGSLGAEGGKNAVISATQSIVTFSGTGTSSGVSLTVTNPVGGACASAAGPMQCLRVVVTPFGKIKMCNPAQPIGSPQGC